MVLGEFPSAIRAILENIPAKIAITSSGITITSAGVTIISAGITITPRMLAMFSPMLAIRQQFTFKNCNLTVDYSENVQITAASESKVLRCVCNCLRIRRLLQRSH